MLKRGCSPELRQGLFFVSPHGTVHPLLFITGIAPLFHLLLVHFMHVLGAISSKPLNFSVFLSQMGILKSPEEGHYDVYNKYHK